MPVTPLADTFLPWFTLLATLVTALNARLALLIVPFLPYDDDALGDFVDWYGRLDAVHRERKKG